MEFGADARVLGDLVQRVRRETRRAVVVKLSPTLPDIAAAACAAVDNGADAITVVNTLPGLVIDTDTRRPALGYGTGGVSGTELRPIGVLATWRVSRAVKVPVVGVGGVATVEDVVQYLLAGATLVGIGTAALQDPRRPEQLVTALERWLARHGVASVTEIIGALQVAST
jgi:dihydroorotate dehydrogenase (NAD+) catalytic subunit